MSRITRRNVPKHEYNFAKFTMIDGRPHRAYVCGATQLIEILGSINNYDEYLGFYGDEKKRIAQARKSKGLDYSDGHNTSEDD